MICRSERPLAIVLLAATSASLGCSSTYVPRPGPRLSVVLEGGAPVLVKQGRKYPTGMFGSGLVDAVEGNAQAEERASTFRSMSIGGFVVGLLGAGAVGASAAVLGYGAASDSTGTNAGLALGLAIGGLVVTAIGSGITAGAQAHYWDAINIYNDSVEPVWVAPPAMYPQRPMGPAPYGPGVYPPPAPTVPMPTTPTTPTVPGTVTPAPPAAPAPGPR